MLLSVLVPLRSFYSEVIASEGGISTRAQQPIYSRLTLFSDLIRDRAAKKLFYTCPLFQRRKLFRFSSDGWSGKGCHVVSLKSSSGQTECSCNHMTHFAVLFDYCDDFKVIFIEITWTFSQLCYLSMCDHGDVKLLTLTLYFFSAANL